MRVDRFIYLTTAVAMIACLFVALSRCAEGCPKGQVMVRGIWGWECVVRG